MPKTEKKTEQGQQKTTYSLNDDRRAKTLSPGAMTTKRFFRNRIAMLGMFILIVMFSFSFVGSAISPYGELGLFYHTDKQTQKYTGVKVNTELRYQRIEKNAFPAFVQARFTLAKGKGTPDFAAGNMQHSYEEAGKDFYVIYKEGANESIVSASLMTMASISGNEALPFDTQLAILKAITSQETSSVLGDDAYTVDEDRTVPKDSQPYACAGRYVINAIMSDVTFSRQFKEELIVKIEAGKKGLISKDVDGTEVSYTLEYDALSKAYSIMQVKERRVYNTYSSPSKAHPLDTDKDGVDVLICLAHGDRVSLYVSFIVVIIETVIGMIMGGISDYFGGWVDMLIMRVVDILYYIPSIPVYIIVGATMGALHVDPQIRMIHLMMILGLFGRPSITRLVRGQILTLREQEFMTAAGTAGVKPINRVFRYLLPNTIPQLVTTCAMSLGGVTPTETTLPSLDPGVRLPPISWRNTINDVNNTYVFGDYLSVWIPADICLLLTVLAFNLMGNGPRDAFDPKVKR